MSREWYYLRTQEDLARPPKGTLTSCMFHSSRQMHTSVHDPKPNEALNTLTVGDCWCRRPDVTGLQPHTGDWLCDLRPTLSRVRHGIVVTCLLSLVDSSMGGRDEGTASLLAWS
jgi:hypothetical protein